MININKLCEVKRNLRETIKNNKFITVIFLVMIVITLFLLIYINKDLTYNIFSEKYNETGNVLLEKSTGDIKQRIQMPEEWNNISAFEVLVKTRSSTKGTITVKLYEGELLLQTWKCNVSTLSNNKYQTFKLDSQHEIIQGVEYYFVIENRSEADIYIGTSTLEMNNKYYISLNDIEMPEYTTCYLLVSENASIQQRVVIDIYIFIFMLIIAILAYECFKVKKGTKWNGLSLKGVYVCAVVMLIVFGFTFQHGDSITITNWGYYLLEAAKAGELRNYASYLTSVFKMSNYNIITNIIAAVMVLPVYIVDSLFKLDLDIYAYDNCRKVMLIICIILSSRILKKIAIIQGYQNEKATMLSILYLISPAVLLGNVAMGQIDCIAVLFIILAFYCILKGRWTIAFMWMSVSALIKEFSIFFAIAPIVCLIVGEFDKNKIIKCTISFMIPVIISWLLSHVFFIDYVQLAAINEQEWNHVARLFDFSVAGSSLFLIILLIVCFMCLCKGMKKMVVKQDYLIACFIVTIGFQICCGQHPQWIIYTIVMLLLCSIYMLPAKEFNLIIITFSIGMYLYSVVGFPENVDNIMLNNGVLGRSFELYYNRFSLYDCVAGLFPNYYSYFPAVGKTIMTSAVIASIYKLRQNKNIEIDKNEKIGVSSLGTIFILFVCNICFVIISLQLYFKGNI